jgi:hypothetical protein
LAQRRAWEKTLGFQDRDRFRAGIEGRISAVDARTGVKQLRMRGSDAVRFCAILKATSVNIFRVASAGHSCRGLIRLELKSPAFIAAFCFSKSWVAFFGVSYNNLSLRLPPIIFLTCFCLLTFYESIMIDLV